MICRIWNARALLYCSNKSAKDIRLKNSLCVFYHHHKTLKSHTCIYILLTQSSKRSIVMSIKLHKNIVPYFYETIINANIPIIGSSCISSVIMKLCTWTTWTNRASWSSKIITLFSFNHGYHFDLMIINTKREQYIFCFSIRRYKLLSTTVYISSKNTTTETIFVKSYHIYQKFYWSRQCFAFEIIS